MNLWDKAYLINLDYEKERYALSAKELYKHNINFERFSAIVDVDPIEGCRESHIAIYKKALNNNIQPLIIEDDIIITKHYDTLIIEDNKIIPEYYFNVEKYYAALERVSKGNWDIFYFYNDTRRIWNIPEEPLLKWGPTTGTHFYIVNKNALEKVIEIASNKNHSLDWCFIYMSRENLLRCYCTTENLVCQDIALGSSIKPCGYRVNSYGKIWIERVKK